MRSRVMRAGSASAGIQLAPLQKMSIPLTRKNNEVPVSSGWLTTSSLRRPTFRSTRSPGMATTASCSGCAPWPAGHHSAGLSSSIDSKTLAPARVTATLAEAVASPKVKISGIVRSLTAASSTSALTVTLPPS